MLKRTPYTERRLAGHYDPPGAPKKTKAERQAESTTTDKLEGLGTSKGKAKP